MPYSPGKPDTAIIIREHGSVSLCRDGQKTKWRLQCQYLCRGAEPRHTVVRLSVCHYAEGGATEVYCNRGVCQSVCLLQVFLVAH